MIHGDIIGLGGLSVLGQHGKRLLNAFHKGRRQTRSQQCRTFRHRHLRSQVRQGHTVGHRNSDGILAAFAALGDNALLSFDLEVGDGGIRRQFTGEIKPVVIEVAGSPLTFLQEFEIPHGGIAALIGCHGIVGHAGRMMEIAAVYVDEVVHPVLQRTVTLTIRESGIGIPVDAHTAKAHHDPCGRLAVGRTPRAKGKVGIHLSQDDFQAQVQLFLYLRTISSIILIGCQRVHDSSHHVNAELVIIAIVQNDIDQVLPRPSGIIRNGVVSHIQSQQRKNGAVDGVLTGIVVERCDKVVDLVVLAVNVRFSIVVLRELRAVKAAGSQHHDGTVKLGHCHVCGCVQLRKLCGNVEGVFGGVVVFWPVFIEAEVHPLPVIIRFTAIPGDDIVTNLLKLAYIRIGSSLRGYRDLDRIGFRRLVLCRDLILDRRAEILHFAGGRRNCGKLGNFDGRRENRRDTLWQRHGDLSRTFVDRGFIPAIAERLDLPPRRYRSAGDRHDIVLLSAVFCGHGIVIFTDLKLCGLLCHFRKFGYRYLRLCRGKVCGIRNRYGHTTAGDRTDRIANLVRENVILHRFFRRDENVICGLCLVLRVVNDQSDFLSKVDLFGFITSLVVNSVIEAFTGIIHLRGQRGQIDSDRQIQLDRPVASVLAIRDAGRANFTISCFDVKGKYLCVRSSLFDVDRPSLAQILFESVSSSITAIIIGACCTVTRCYRSDYLSIAQAANVLGELTFIVGFYRRRGKLVPIGIFRQPKRYCFAGGVDQSP